MTRFLDARVPVAFGDAVEVTPETALLVEGDAAVPEGAIAMHFTVPAPGSDHPAGCACCIPRGPAAEALTRLFLGRARAELPWFGRVHVIAAAAGRQAVLAALEEDPVVSARFRLDQAGSVVSPAPSARCM
jgi:hypothetical protein